MVHLKDKRWCYYMPPTPNGEKQGKPDHYFVGIVVADEPDYYLTDWDYGTDQKLAEEAVASMNRQKLNLTEAEVSEIICSSMFKKKRRVV